MKYVKRRKFGAKPYDLRAELHKTFPTASVTDISAMLLVIKTFGGTVQIKHAGTSVVIYDNRIIGVGMYVQLCATPRERHCTRLRMCRMGVGADKGYRRGMVASMRNPPERPR